jgi:hypothetical protein
LLPRDHDDAFHVVEHLDATHTVCGLPWERDTLGSEMSHEYNPYIPFEDNCESCHALRCANCGGWDDRHVEGKCLFMETRYVPM